MPKLRRKKLSARKIYPKLNGNRAAIEGSHQYEKMLGVPDRKELDLVTHQSGHP